MRAVKGKNSKIEVKFRKALWKAGFRYSTNSRRYFGTPDLVLRRYKTVIFVDSCFWHGCKRHGTQPKVRAKFWRLKIEANRARDRAVTTFYRKKNWKVFRIWEHDIRKQLIEVIHRIQTNLRCSNESKN